MRTLLLLALVGALLVAGCATPEEAGNTAECPGEDDSRTEATDGDVEVWLRNGAPRDAVFCVSVNDEGPVAGRVPEPLEDSPRLVQLFRASPDNDTITVDAAELEGDLSTTESFTVAEHSHVVVTLTQDERLTIEFRTTSPEQ